MKIKLTEKHNINSLYRRFESYDSRFGNLSKSLESLRRECLCLYLSTIPEIYEIFELNNNNLSKKEIQWIMLINSIVNGIVALEYFCSEIPPNGSWESREQFGKFLFFKFLLINGIMGLEFNINLRTGKVCYTYDRDTPIEDIIKSVSEMFFQIHELRLTGKVEEAAAIINRFSHVDKQFRILKKEFDNPNGTNDIYIQEHVTLNKSKKNDEKLNDINDEYNIEQERESDIDDDYDDKDNDTELLFTEHELNKEGVIKNMSEIMWNDEMAIVSRNLLNNFGIKESLHF